MRSVAGRIVLGVAILVLQFAGLEAGLRWFGSSEASPGFQSLFIDDPIVGHRLRPGAHTRFTTVEFSTDLAINAQGVRDDTDIGPKGPRERRILVLGDSLVLAVQVDLATTFCRQLQGRLNRDDPAHQWRVINGGVQGYGPVEEWLFFKNVAEAFRPDLVLVVTFVANDAQEAYGSQAGLDDGHLGSTSEAARPAAVVHRIVRSSVVLQITHRRLDQFLDHFAAPQVELPLAVYLADEPPFIARGLAVARRALGMIADRAREDGARTGIVLMPARFQTDDEDYGRLADSVRQAGGTLVRNSATERFRQALAPLDLPTLDLLPVLSAEPTRADLFFQANIHLTPRGHTVVASAIAQFLERQGLLDRR